MPASDNSKRYAGGGSRTRFLMESRSGIVGLFDKRDLIDLFQGRDALARFGERRIAQEGHALVAGGAANFGGRAFVENHFADFLGEVEEVVNRAAAAESGAAAFETSRAFVKCDVAPLFRVESAFDQKRVRIFHRDFAVRAD